eukprot:392897-Rhodomonas_salina.2
MEEEEEGRVKKCARSSTTGPHIAPHTRCQYRTAHRKRIADSTIRSVSTGQRLADSGAYLRRYGLSGTRVQRVLVAA